MKVETRLGLNISMYYAYRHEQNFDYGWLFLCRKHIVLWHDAAHLISIPGLFEQLNLSVVETNICDFKLFQLFFQKHS